MPGFKFYNKKILIISPEPWDFIKVSKHHYAMEFTSRGNSVYFLNPPDNQFQVVECKRSEEGVYVIDYKNRYKGVRFLPKPVRKFIFKKLYNKFQKIAKESFDVVFLFENSRFFDLDFLPANVFSVYFQVDEDQNFHPHQAARSANLVLAINNVIKDLLSQSGKAVYRISHGFSGNFSTNATSIWNGHTIYRRSAERLKAFYIGNLDHYFSDIDLLAALIRSTPDVDFVFIGPYNKSGKLYQLIKDNGNVFLYGKVAASDIPGMLDDADLLFFAYRDDFLSSSHKVMEYLASGKAIVTTKVKGYPEDPDLFYCSGNSAGFIDLFKYVCDNIEEANSSVKMKKRIQFAIDNTYKKRVVEIEELADQFYMNN